MAFKIWVFGMRGIVWHHCYHGLDAQNINSNKTAVAKILTRRIGPMRIYKQCGIGLRIDGNNGERRPLALAATAEVIIHFTKMMFSFINKLPVHQIK